MEDASPLAVPWRQIRINSDLGCQIGGYGENEDHEEDKENAAVICLELLLAAGAGRNVRDNKGHVPLQSVAGNSARQHLVRRITASGARVHAVSDDGRTPLHHAEAGCADAACLLLRAGRQGMA